MSKWWQLPHVQGVGRGRIISSGGGGITHADTVKKSTKPWPKIFVWGQSNHSESEARERRLTEEILSALPDSDKKSKLLQMLKAGVRVWDIADEVAHTLHVVHAKIDVKQHFVVKRCTGAGQKVTFQLEYSLVSPIDGTTTGAVIRTSQRWNRWMVAMLESDIREGRLKIPPTTKRVDQVTLQRLLAKRARSYDEQILLGRLHVVGGPPNEIASNHERLLQMKRMVHMLQDWRAYPAGQTAEMVMELGRLDVNKELVESSGALDLITQLTEHLTPAVSSEALKLKQYWDKEHVMDMASSGFP